MRKHTREMLCFLTRFQTGGNEPNRDTQEERLNRMYQALNVLHRDAVTADESAPTAQTFVVALSDVFGCPANAVRCGQDKYVIANNNASTYGIVNSLDLQQLLG
jgi:hypothetical protein